MRKKKIALCLAVMLLFNVSMTSVAAADAVEPRFALSFRLLDGKSSYNPGDTITADIYLSHPTVATIGSFNTTVTCDPSILTLQEIAAANTADVTVTGNPSNGKIALVSTSEGGFLISAAGVKITTVKFLVNSPATPGFTKISFGSTSVADSGGNTVDPLNLDEPSTEILIATSGHKVSGTVSFNGAASFETTARLYLATDVTGTGKVDANTKPIGSAVVNDDKTFEISNVPDGTYTLVVSKKNHTDAFVFNVVVNGGDVPITELLKLYAGDLNKDNKINALDLGMLMTVFNKPADNIDVTGDIKVNALDLGVLMQTFNGQSWKLNL